MFIACIDSIDITIADSDKNWAILPNLVLRVAYWEDSLKYYLFFSPFTSSHISISTTSSVLVAI